MLGTLGSALLIVAASYCVGRAFMALIGRDRMLWLELPVGLGILLCVCSVLTRLSFGGSIPDRDELSLIACALLVVASVAYLRTRLLDREVLVVGGPVLAVSGLVMCLPFLASGHLGIPGVGVNNDMAAHLVFAEYLRDASGPSPSGIRYGYPLGPHGMVATLAGALGTQSLYGFLGLLVAIPVMTALTALRLLSRLSPVKRPLAATLVGVPYLVAATFGISGFKEMMAGLFLLAFVLILRELPREERKIPSIAALGVLAAAMVATYSYPGLLWLGGTAVLWAAGEYALARRHGRLDELRAGVRRAAPLVGLAVGVMLVLAIAELPRIKDFIDSGAAEVVIDTDSKLRYAVPAPEALGVWPSGEFLFGYGDGVGLGAWQLFAAVGLVAFGFACVWWVRREEVALPAAVVASAVVYVGTIFAAGLYVEAKALQVPAAMLMLFILGALLLPWGRGDQATGPDGSAADPATGATRPIGPAWLRAAIAVPFVTLAAYSSFLALRDAIIAPTDRFDELAEFRDRTVDTGVLDLTSDRYFDYYLRDADVRSPAVNAELKFPGRPGKAQRLPVDFDSPNPRQLNFPDYAVTTSADYQSGAPPNFEEVDRTDSYILWKRTGQTPFLGVFAEESRPGRVLRCKSAKVRPLLKRDGKNGVAITWPRPVIAKRLYWETDGDRVEIEEGETRQSAAAELAAGETARQTIELPPGNWELSFQYSSPIMPLRVEADGLDVEVPPGLEGALPYRPDQGPYFPIGTVESDGGELELTVTANELSRVQRLLGVDATAALGNIAATRLEDLAARPLLRACKRYVDHYYLRTPGGLRSPLASGGTTLKLEPSR